jgi:hypothetical protein
LLQQIEREKDQPPSAVVGRLLNQFESGHAVQTDAAEFAVDIGCPDFELGECCGGRRIFFCPVEP